MTGPEWDHEIRGRSALVTGASRGIGLAVATRLARAGAWVGMTARGEAELAIAAREVGGHAIVADVSSVEGARGLAATLRESLGGSPDVIVNAAGSFGLASIPETDPAEWDRMLDTNLRGPFLVIREMLPGMVARGAGHVVNIGSVAGRVALPGNGAYGASKFGLRGFHEVLAAELDGTGVRATLIEPGATDTGMWDPLDPDSRADLPSRSAMLRADDVARAVMFALAQPAGVEVSVLALRASSPAAS